MSTKNENSDYKEYLNQISQVFDFETPNTKLDEVCECIIEMSPIYGGSYGDLLMYQFVYQQ